MRMGLAASELYKRKWPNDTHESWEVIELDGDTARRTAYDVRSEQSPSHGAGNGRLEPDLETSPD